MQLLDSAALTLEIVLIIAMITKRPTSTLLKTLAAALACCLILHLFIEGLRWQMVPAYLVITVTLIFAALRLIKPKTPDTKFRGRMVVRWSGTGLACAGVVLSALLSYAFPIFEVPAPTGKYPIGTAEIHLIDDRRAETYTAAPDDHRELMLRIWYPAELSKEGDRARYWRNPIARSRAVTKTTPLPWFTFTHLGLVDTHSHWDAPISKAEPAYPVVLYSHGIGLGWASSNTKLAEGLASHGYVVVGIDHAYVGSISLFPDGRLAEFDAQTAKAMGQPPPPEVADLQAQMQTGSDWRKHIALYLRAMALMPHALKKVSAALQTQVADQQFVIRQLSDMQNSPQTNSLITHLDLEDIGIIGMSLGGSAALEACAIDRRCKAGVNLDGFHPQHIDLVLQDTPFLFINRKDNLLFKTNYYGASSAVYSVLISDVTHFNFFDFSIMSPLYKQLGVLGPIDGERVLGLLERYAVAFFDKHLKQNQDIDLAGLSETYPEVEFAQRNQKPKH